MTSRPYQVKMSHDSAVSWSTPDQVSGGSCKGVPAFSIIMGPNYFLGAQGLEETTETHTQLLSTISCSQDAVIAALQGRLARW